VKSEFLQAFLIGYSDSDFTNPHEAMLPDEPRDCRGDFTHMGAKYWGFESRRHRATTVVADKQALLYDHGAHDWLLIGLKRRAEVSVARISTMVHRQPGAQRVGIFERRCDREEEAGPLPPAVEAGFGA
jgi:allantoicase